MRSFLLGKIMASKIKTVSSSSGPFTYASYVFESFDSGKQIRAYIDEKENTFILDKNDKQNVAIIKSLKDAYKANKREVVLSIIKDKKSTLKGKGNTIRFLLGDVIKPPKEVPELGYIGEAIIQSGMFARFVNKDKDISRKDIEYRLNEFLDSYRRGSDDMPLQETSPNYQQKGYPKVPDDLVICRYELAEPYCEWLLKANGKYNQSPYTALDSLFRDAVAFANSPTVTSQSKEIYYNQRQDFIVIEGTGVSGQNKTKADIKVYKYVGWERGKSNGIKTEINLRVSAKIKDITQFGQVSGLTWNKQTFLFDQLMGVDISRVKDKYDKLVPEPSLLISNSQVRLNAYSLTYQEAIKQFNSSSNKLQKIINGIKHFMTLNEDETGGVTLVVVSIGGASLSITDTSRLTVEMFKKFMDDNKYTEKDIHAVFHQTDAGRQIDIKVKDEKLLNLSGRWTALRCANYVNGGPALYKILKIKT